MSRREPGIHIKIKHRMLLTTLHRNSQVTFWSMFLKLEEKTLQSSQTYLKSLFCGIVNKHETNKLRFMLIIYTTTIIWMHKYQQIYAMSKISLDTMNAMWSWNRLLSFMWTWYWLLLAASAELVGPVERWGRLNSPNTSFFELLWNGNLSLSSNMLLTFSPLFVSQYLKAVLVGTNTNTSADADILRLFS